MGAPHPSQHSVPTARCDCGKRAYRTRKEAARVAAKLRREKGQAINHYRCAEGKVWHVGHPPGLWAPIPTAEVVALRRRTQDAVRRRSDG